MRNNNVPKTAVDDEQDGDEEGGNPRRINNGIRPVEGKKKAKTKGKPLVRHFLMMKVKRRARKRPRE